MDDTTDANNNADTADDEVDIIKNLISLLQHRREFPVQQREGTILELARHFHHELKRDIHTMITNQSYDTNYTGLDATRDTEAEVEMALRCYPENISKRKTEIWDHGVVSDSEDEEFGDDNDRYGGWVVARNRDEGEYPINCLTYVRNDEGGAVCNKKALPFIHLFAQLAIEFKSFTDDERGGLCVSQNYDDNGTLNNVAKNLAFLNDHDDDCICMTQLVRLRQLGFLTKQDVLDQYLVEQIVCRKHEFIPGRRFRFIIEWNPMALTRANEYGRTLLHYTPWVSLEAFQVTFDYCIRYYPHMKGIHMLFQDYSSVSPLHQAVESFGREKVIKVVEEILGRYSVTTPIHTMQALMVAATDATIHLDGVYFLIRREPNVVVRSLLRQAPKEDEESPPPRNTDDPYNKTVINNNSSSNIDEDDDTHNCSNTNTHDTRNGVGEDGDGTRNTDHTSKILKRKRQNN